MNKVWKKVISAFLALVMVFQMFPTTALAGNYQEEFDEEFDWEMPEKEEPDVVGEVEELRDHTSKQFRLSDGSFAAVNYGIPVHYLDDDDNWVDVDNTLVYAENAGQYLSVNGEEQRGFADTLANGQPVLVSQYEDYSVELTLLPMTYETVRNEQELMVQQDVVSEPVESEPVTEATEAPETTVPEETNEETNEETTVSEPELTGEKDSTSETLGTDAEETGESEATEAPTESVEETEETAESAESAETEVTESIPETTVPEETVLETTQAEETVPETTIPEETEDPTTESEEAVPEATTPVETVPETTVPGETVIPETSGPDLEEIVTETVEPSSVAAIVLNPGDASTYSSREDMPLSEQVLPEKMGSYVIYEGVFPGIDLMYENYGYNIKETILVNELQDSYAYSFLLKADGLTAALSDNGSIALIDVDGDIIYEIPAPYMFDAAGESSYAVEYALEETDSGYILTVTADAEWIEDGERVLPVAIDPTITVKCEYVSGGTLYTTHVVQGDPNLAHNGDNEQYIGYGMGYNSTGTVPIRECQIFLHVADLPDIPEGCTMVEATLQMYNYGVTGYSYIGNCTDLEIAAYPVTSAGPSNGDYKSWIEGLTWNTKPTFDKTKLIDFAIASTETQGGYIQWDLTEQVDKWYEENTVNRTLALAGYESGSYTSTYCAVAVLKGFGTSNPPTLIVKYRSAIGIESYYSAQTQNIGTAGTAYVGDYTGQLVLVKNLASHASTVMPFSLNLVYNSYYATTRFKEARNTSMYFGNGWKLDAVQTLSKCTGDLSNYMLYIDGDGTYHYFKANGSQWDDEDGLDMTIKKASITSTSGSTLTTAGYAISNGQGDQLLFYNGFLVQQADANGNKIYYLYNGATNASSSSWLPTTGSTNKLTKVIQHNDGATEDITLATLTYNSSTNRLEKVQDRAECVYTLGYDSSGNLISASSTNGHTAEYTYSGGYMNEAKDTTGLYKIDYDFTDDRVSKITEKAGSSWTTGTVVVVSGSRDKTTYRFPGIDGTSGNTDDILTTYLFDDEGRTINSNTTNADQSVVYGASTGAYATTSGTSNTNNHLMNSATIGTAAVNLISNGGFETESSTTTGLAAGWAYTQSATSGMAITMKDDGHRTGNYALKTWFNSSTTGTLRAYQTVSGLTSGATYTFSAYVNTTGVTSFGSGGGVYLNISSGGSGSSDTVNYFTSSAMDSGWTRISVTFTATSTSAVLNIYVKNAVGIVYVDDCQLEKDDAPSNVNLLVNGAMESSTGWNLKTPSYTSIASGGLGGSKAMAMTVNPTTHAYIVQTVPVNLPYTETYVLSGWAKADALPNNQPQLPKKKLFTLKAELYYADGTYDEYFLPFSAEIDNEWQFASMVLVPKQQKTVTKILVLCCYFQNTGTALFDNISLIREPAQTMTYDSNGYLTSVATPGVGSDTNTYTNGNLTKTQTSGNGTYTYTYDSNHNVLTASNGVVTQSFGYDAAGNVVNSNISGTNASEKIYTHTTFTPDMNHELVITDSRGKTTTNAYAAATNYMYGAPSSVTNPLGTTINYTYHNDGALETQKINNLVSLAYTYECDNLTSIVRTGVANSQATGTLGNSQTYSLSYNKFGQVGDIYVGTASSGIKLVSNSYNTDGTLNTLTHGNGDSTTYTYDELGRVKTAKTTDSGTGSTRTATYAYTTDGYLGEVKLGTTMSYRYMYDSLGRLITSSQHNGSTLKLETRHEYDTSNRLSKQHINLVDKTYSESYTYDSYGRLSKMTTGNGKSITMAYDGLSRVSTVTGPVSKATYSYTQGTTTGATTTLVSKLVYSAVNSNSLDGLTFSYLYDDQGNISQITDPISGSTKKYTYDSLGQMLKETIGTTTYTYTYDSYGNIRSGKGKNYTYGNTTWRDLLTAYDTQNIAYEGQTYTTSGSNISVSGNPTSGNPISYYNGTRWTFDWKNGRELNKATSSTTSVTYGYDMTGIRTSKTVGTTTHSYIYASGKLIRETYGSTTLDFLYDQNGNPFAMIYNGTPYYYILNLQGDVVRLVNASGTAVATYQYDAWGRLLSSSGSVASINPLRYRGYYYDSETGFYYLQSRYYDPAIGRFINADSFVSTGQGFAGYNMFAYCNNNPVNMKDSAGDWPELSTVYATVAVAALTVAAISAFVVASAITVPALITMGGALVSTASVVSAAVTVGTQAATVAVCTSVAAIASKSAEKRRTQTYTVYFLEDASGKIQYVGRVTDSGYAARMSYHKLTRNLTPQYRVSGLTYSEARGLEEIGMIECHTLNPSNPVNNQIHGISPRNESGERYMIDAIDYLDNRAENFLLDLIS